MFRLPDSTIAIVASSTMAVIPSFQPGALKVGAGFAMIFTLETRRKKESYWFAGEIEELKIEAGMQWARIMFNDGTCDWHPLDNQYYNTPEEMLPGRIIWRLYTEVPLWEKEQCFIAKPVVDAVVDADVDPVEMGDVVGEDPEEEDPAKASSSGRKPGVSGRKRKAVGSGVGVGVGDGDIKKFVMEAIDEAIDPLKSKISELEEAVNELKHQANEGVSAVYRPRMTGIFTHEDMTDFNKISVAEKAKYLGNGKWQGISDPYRNVKMCASYKLIDAEYACVSKEYDSDNREYYSGSAAYVSWSWYLDAEVVTMTPKEIVTHLKDRSVCKSCAIQCFGGTSSLHQISERGKLCGICKDKLVSFQKQEGVIPECSECIRAMNSEGNRERIVVKAMQMIPKRFDTCGITLRIKESNNGRVPDFIMTGTYSNTKVVKGKFYIVIERDQDQHRGYDRDDELDKMVTQVAPLLKAETSRVFVIRYTPEGKWKDSDDNDVGADIKEGPRLVMVRNWVNWYIASLATTNLKRLITLYMFYDRNNTDNLFEVGSDSFGMTDKAPKGSISPHEFSVECCEVDNQIYAKAQRYVDVKDVFKDVEWKQGDKLSKAIRDGR